MSDPEDDPYDDADQDSYAEGNRARPQRGTASRATPLKGGSPPDTEQDGTVTITAPDSSVREYELTDAVKERYETKVEKRFEHLDVDWFDCWWEGTTLVVDYQGKVRDADLRDSGDDEDDDNPQNPFSQPSGMPRDPHPAWYGRMGTQSVGISPHRDPDAEDTEHFDGGMAPVSNRTTIDIQERADARPLDVEDVFVRPWTDDAGQMPINTDNADGEVKHEIEDFRDTDEEETLREGARGNRYHL